MINRDTIIAHALKSGFAPGFQPGQTDALCKFAEFVAAAEREQCFQIALTIGDTDAGACRHTDAVASAIRERGAHDKD